MAPEGGGLGDRRKLGACQPRAGGSQGLTDSTELCKPVLSLLRVDQVTAALLGGCPLQHCFKQGRRDRMSQPSAGLPTLQQRVGSPALELEASPEADAERQGDPGPHGPLPRLKQDKEL